MKKAYILQLKEGSGRHYWNVGDQEFNANEKVVELKEEQVQAIEKGLQTKIVKQVGDHLRFEVKPAGSLLNEGEKRLADYVIFKPVEV